MYAKITCPHCEKNAFMNVGLTYIQTQTATVAEEIKILETIKEEDLLKIVSKFISQNIQEGMNKEDLQDVLKRCLGISPQFTDEIISNIQTKGKKARRGH